MRFITLAAAGALILTLAACDDKPACTQAQVQEKAATLMTKIMQLSMTDPAKAQEVTVKLEEIGRSAQGNDPNDLSAACKTLDDMLAELG